MIGLLLACHAPGSSGDPAPDEPVDSADTGPFDADGDGWLAAEDCDDHDHTVHPGEWETCNGQDDDCNGQVDDPATVTEHICEVADGTWTFNVQKWVKYTTIDLVSLRPVGDLDGDGRDDLVLGVAPGRLPDVSVDPLLRWGNAGVVLASQLPTLEDVFEGYQGWFFASDGYAIRADQLRPIGDVTDDGTPDVCVPDDVGTACFSGARFTAEPDQWDRWSANELLDGAWLLDGVDLDADGRAEVPLTTDVSGRYGLVPVDTVSDETTWADAPTVTLWPEHLAYGDVDGDGLAEVGSVGEASVVLLAGDEVLAGVATVESPWVELPEVASAVSLTTDLDGDGRPDVAVAGAGAALDGWFSADLESSPGPSVVRIETPAGGGDGLDLDDAGDLDGDGFADLWVTAGDPAAIGLFAGGGLAAGTHAWSEVLRAIYSSEAVELDGFVTSEGDLDGDGTRDLLLYTSVGSVGVFTE